MYTYVHIYIYIYIYISDTKMTFKSRWNILWEIISCPSLHDIARNFDAGTPIMSSRSSLNRFSSVKKFNAI
jgi:hypothetical protein